MTPFSWVSLFVLEGEGGLLVISYVNPTTCGPKGHANIGGLLQIYPRSHPRPTILRETTRPPAVKVGLPFLLLLLSAGGEAGS